MAVSSLALAQEKLPDLDYIKINESAQQASDEGDMQKVLEQLARIHPKDSVYCSTLITASYYNLKLENYKETIAVADRGLQGDCDSQNYGYYINKGVAFLRQDQYVQALEVFEEALKEYPKNSQIWYNKGLVLKYQEKLPEAIKAFQNAILYKPSYPEPHLRLGEILYSQGKTAQAMMSYNLYLLLAPDGEDSFNILNGLNNLANISNPNQTDRSIVLSPETFDEIDLIINNKLALNDQYKVEGELQFPLIKQNHVLLEQLASYEGSEGFWAKVYVPLYQWIWKNGHFRNFSYTVSYSIQNEDLKKIVEKKVPEIKGFLQSFGAEWANLLNKPDFRINPEDEGKTFYYENGNLNGTGMLQEGIFQGPWKFYSFEGRKSGEGSFDDKGNRTGIWTWYYPSGKVKETAFYKDGKLEGENIMYFENGKLRSWLCSAMMNSMENTGRTM